VVISTHYTGFQKNGNFQTYWYPDATRFIVEKFGAMDNTIHEFPIYSFIVADLHGHLLNLPFVLLFIGMLLRLFLFKKHKNYRKYFIWTSFGDYVYHQFLGLTYLFFTFRLCYSL